MIIAHKLDGTWYICSYYKGLNAITRLAVEPLQHNDSTRESRSFTKLDLASINHQLQVLPADR